MTGSCNKPHPAFNGAFQASGKRVDRGSTVGQFFFISRATKIPLEENARARARLYVIRNGKIGPEWQTIEPTSFKIANRSRETLIKSQARGDVERLYVQAKSDGIAFRLAAIPDIFDGASTEPFDKAYMRRLFDLGCVAASRGYPWPKHCLGERL